jgi:hypothetical protein
MFMPWGCSTAVAAALAAGVVDVPGWAELALESRNPLRLAILQARVASLLARTPSSVPGDTCPIVQIPPLHG